MEREVAANAATNRHDFLVALERAEKQALAYAALLEAEDGDESAKAALARSGLRMAL